MENILATMRGYLQMDTEIDAAEFNSFYNFDFIFKSVCCKLSFHLFDDSFTA